MSLRKINKKATMMIAGLMIAVFVFTGCSTSANIPEDAVAVVNGNNVSMEEFTKTLALQRMNYESQFGEDIFTQDTGSGMSLLDSVKQGIVEKLILEELLIREAEKNNITVTEEEIEEAYKPYLDFKEQNEEFKQFAEENDMNEAYIKQQIKKDILSVKYRDFFIEELGIDEAAARNFYEENMEFFQIDEVSARHILVRNNPEKAKEILAQINNEGDFNTLADEYLAAGDGAIIVEELGRFGRGRMVPEFENAVFSMEAGEVSGIVETQFGHHIVLVQEVIKETHDFETAKSDIIQHLGDMEFQNHMEELLNQADVEIREEL
ncbi:MAG: SurA N-terminal domain-containing protein [Clostridiaceae bacterium]|nr:SurA N-terminal domain-containing protein [Clostridiaceae bacterium]